MVGSLGYAERLKNKRRLGGQLGATEFSESVETVEDKVQELANLIAAGKPVFLFTGAGISTSVGIPDFRGPTGIWTLKKKKQPITAPLTPFEHAKPSFTHMVCAALIASGKANMICSQNVDSLHLRSGVPRNRLAELHGNCFAERCPVCKTEYVRDFQVETLDFKPTGRQCVQPGCQGALIDNVLDWDSPLPDDELDASIEAAGEAGVCLVLGSSLQISPANEIPLVTVDNKGKLAIINLQKTPRDRRAKVIVRAKVDPVMALLSRKLNLTISPYLRMDGVVVCHKVTAAGGCTVKAESSDSKAESDHQHQKTQLGVLDPTLAGSVQHTSVKLNQPEESINGDSYGQPVKTESKTEAVPQEHHDQHSVQLMVRSIHGQTCVLPMIQSITATVDTDDDSQGQGLGGMTVAVHHIGQPVSATGHEGTTDEVAGQVAEQPAQQGGIDASVQGNQTVEGVLQQPNSFTAHTPAVSGGVPLGGPYEFVISKIPDGITAIRCHLKLHLVQWADGNKRVVDLQPYIIHLARASTEYPSDEAVASLIRPTGLTLPCQAPSQTLQSQGFPQPPSATPAVPQNTTGNSTSSNNGITEEGGVGPQGSTAATSNDLLPAQQYPSLGPLPTVQVTSDQAALYTFFTQEVRYDPPAVWDAFKADPPPVLLPQARAAKKPKTTGSLQNLKPSQIADLKAAAAGVTLRRSGRRGSVSVPNLTEETIKSDDLEDDQNDESDNEPTDDN